MADPNNNTRRALNTQLALGDRLYKVFCGENPVTEQWWDEYCKWLHTFRSAVEWEEANNPDGKLPTVWEIERVTHEVEDAAGLWDHEKAAFEKFQREQQDKAPD